MNSKTLTPAHIAIMAVSAGVCVANIYYNQPILPHLARTFQASENEVGRVAVLAQAGYGVGLFFLTPLGDKLNRKRLMLFLQVLLVIALGCMAMATSLLLVNIMSFFIGLFAVSVQIIVPMAASLAKENRGRVVGIIFTGILVGVLFARVFSGFIAEWFGWRYVYGISAGMVGVVALALQLSLPNVSSAFTGTYGQLLSSTLAQIGRFPLLRNTALLGALVFGTFCSFWTTLTFHLSGPPFQYQTGTIGLFGLLAIGAALLAPVFGKQADKGNALKIRLFMASLLILSVLIVKVFPLSASAFILTVLLLDLGAQSIQVTNTALIYTLDSTAHSRINTVYMTSYFIGGAIGTFVGIQAWAWGGWNMVTWQLLLWSSLAMFVLLIGSRLKTATA
ncbi:MFS transporter [Spirosoma fluviale]|uniref:Predicted arabinose efflux permease, MFS family n=1 Tax=Spirosoma fluviale TaxID=1597977 RepID=A0A286FJB1_9BACT|nr:MFS transporter [Spirosoma fluviale]SOD83310.1 Predicted arabinose efflux permease, MFS family [Spirosoma fluviale]